ncbi:MAG: hypothetical protein WD934_01800 [Gemmatimonadales bacterium]
MRTGAVLTVLGVLVTTSAHAQLSLVPTDHPVYEWLHRQRVRGVVPRYDYEALPLTRGLLRALLDEASAGGLSRIDRSLAATYRSEFSVDTVAPQTLLQGQARGVVEVVREKISLVLSERESHLYRYAGPEANVTVDYFMGGGAFGGTEVSGTGPDKYELKHVRLFGTLYDRIGFHLDAQNASGSNLLRFHPQWGTTPEVTAGGSATVWAQGFVTTRYRALQFDIGTGTQRLGAPGREAVILRSYSSNYDWVRISLATPGVQYMFTHGSLVAATRDTVVPGTAGTLTRIAPSRWIAVRRVQLRPSTRLQLGFTEALAYSNRGVELAYLNPIYPLRVAEFNTNDRDNPVWYLDGVFRPINGLEFSATLGIDDLSIISDVLRPTGGRNNNDLTTKLLYQAWGTVAIGSGTDLFAGYLRVEPFFYTHKLGLNTFQQWDLPLGADVGPNADEWTVGFRQWLPRGGWMRFSGSGGRHGMNPLDASGNMVEDVGGSLSSVHLGQRILFLRGDLHRTTTFRMDGGIEPIRGWRFDVAVERRVVRAGTQIANRTILRFGTSLMFYPIDVLLLPIN